MTSYMKQWKTTDVGESSETIHHSIGLCMSFPNINVLLKSSDKIKSYGHLSMTFLFCYDLLPNMVKSRDPSAYFENLLNKLVHNHLSILEMDPFFTFHCCPLQTSFHNIHPTN